jgi:Amt family ammonium transporter
MDMQQIGVPTEVGYILNTFWFVMAGALVMWMAAGFAMLEAGLVRSKNTAEILTKNVSLYALASLLYFIVGYNLMYGSGNSFIGSGFALSGISYDSHSHLADFFFQVVFCATAMSIVSGAVAERMKLWAFLAFAVVMTGLIYPIQGHWSWGGGFLDAMGFSDYAGSTIVHGVGAAAALAGVLILGPRKGKYGKDGRINAIPGANMPLATLGTFVLWLGWFGFNGGSALALDSKEVANEVALVFTSTNMSAAAGAIAALILAKVMFGKADLTMLLNGAIAGLVGITAGPAVDPGLAIFIGAVSGLLVVLSIVGLDKLHIDDPVGAISAHGTAGIWGTLAVGIFGSASIGSQIIGILTIWIFTFVASAVVWYILKATMGIRVSEEMEYEGMDLIECGLEAYPEFDTSRT